MIPACIPRQSVTFAASELDDVDGIKESFATVAEEAELTSADYDGAGVANSGHTWAKYLPRSVTISRADAAGSYTTDPIVMTGTFNGSTVTESLTPADTDGDDILRGVQLFDYPPDITIPAQADTSGSFTIGVGDIGATAPDTFVGVELAEEGYINVGYVGGLVDELHITGGQIGFPKPLGAKRVRTSASLSNPTTVGLTVYLP